MLTFHGMPTSPIAKESALTIGVFDGVHRGHATLIRRVIERARAEERLAGVVTFDPHPMAVLAPQVPLRYLGDLDERLARLEALGADFVVVLPFTRELSQTSARDFVRPLVDLLRLHVLVIGHDFTLGHKRQGNEAFLRELGTEWDFEVEAIEAVRAGEGVTSSTRIRQLLAGGLIAEANRALGYAYALKGILDDERNLAVPAARQLPGDGHYQCTARTGAGRMACACEVGGDRLRVVSGGLKSGPLVLEFTRDATAEREGFTEVEHTADVGLCVRAATFPELLRQAALGMTALMAEAPEAVSDGAERRWEVGLGEDRESALVDFLSSVLWTGETQHELYFDFAMLPGDGQTMPVVGYGAPATNVRKQIKAVTFHDLKVFEAGGMLETTIVFDV